MAHCGELRLGLLKLVFRTIFIKQWHHVYQVTLQRIWNEKVSEKVEISIPWCLTTKKVTNIVQLLSNLLYSSSLKPHLFIRLFLKTRKRFLQVIFKSNKWTIYTLKNSNDC